MKYLNLIRYKNLLIIAITQYLVKYSLIDSYGYISVLSDFEFALGVLSTLLMAAGGYAINDYFDVNVDRINKSKTQVVGESIKRSTALAVHLLGTGLSIAIGWYLVYVTGWWILGIINPLFAVLLWFYSTHFKKMFVVGNLLIAGTTAFTAIVVVVLFCLAGSIKSPFQENLLVAYVYTGFAFLASWIREIIKDLEDHVGDSAMGYDTLAINFGMEKAVKFTFVLSFLMLALILFFGFIEFNGSVLALGYILILLVLPQTYFMMKLRKAKSIAQFKFLSRLSKAIMIAGVLSLPVFTWLSQNAWV